jgi:chromosomal replication initiation ATPase DnaA
MQPAPYSPDTLTTLGGEAPYHLDDHAVRAILATVLTVTREFHVKPSVLFPRCRNARVATARMTAMVLLRRRHQLTYMEIGGIFRRDHGTAIHAIHAISSRATTDRAFGTVFERLLALTDPDRPAGTTAL